MKKWLLLAVSHAAAIDVGFALGIYLRVKARSARVGDAKRFDNFIVEVPASVDVARDDTVVVWCETFSQFISAAKYR